MYEIMPYDGVRDAMAEIYGRHFSKDELRDLVRFYRSETGKKAVSVMPKITAEAMQFAMKDVQTNLRPKLDALLRRITAADAGPDAAK